MTDTLRATMDRVAQKIKAREAEKEATPKPKGPKHVVGDPASLPVAGKNTPTKTGNPHSVNLSNALARAAHGLTLVEKRILSCCIAEINSKEAYDNKHYLASSLSAKKYAEQFDLNIDVAYKELKQAGDRLLKRQVSFFETAKTMKGKIRRGLVRSNWVQQVKYVDQDGYIEILWTHKIGMELKGLYGNFTTYKLKNASALRSIYSWRLLEYFESWKGNKTKKLTKDGLMWDEISVEDFATMMDATEKQKKDFSNIRRRMIEPAVKDLIEKDGWIIKWKPLKYGGRRISGIRFEFKRNPQGRLF